MKKLFLLVFVMLLAKTASSQYLTPQRAVEGKDTFFVFSTQQAKELAKIFVKQRYQIKELQQQDSLIRKQDNLLHTRSQIIGLQSQQIEMEQARVAQRDSLIKGQETALQAQMEVVEGLEKAVRKQKRKTSAVSFIATVVVITLLIIL